MDVIYHGGCVDGFTAAYVTWLKYQDNGVYHFGKYGQKPPAPQSDRLMLVDFSYPREQIVDLAKQVKTVTIYDHHKTAVEALVDLPDNVKTVFDMHRSGAGITWDALYPDIPRTPLINYVEDNDLWVHEIDGWKAVSAYLRAQEFTFESWMKIDLMMQRNLQRVLDLGGAMVTRQNGIMKECMDNARMFHIGGYDVPGCAAPYSLGSETAGELAKGYPFAAYYVDKGDERQFGLRRSDGNVDVSEIAKKYGGGGHATAAGFNVPRDSELGRT